VSWDPPHRLTFALLFALQGSLAGCFETASDDRPPTPPPKVETREPATKVAFGPAKSGRILVGQSVEVENLGTRYVSHASAAFVERDPQSETGCTKTPVQGCDVYECDNGATIEGVASRSAGAGKIDIAGGLTSYSLAPTAGAYETVTSPKRLYQAGTVLRVSATGDEVPAFSNQTLPIPAPLVVESPSFGIVPSISRQRELALSWSGDGGRDVKIALSTAESGGHGVSVVCIFPGPATSGTVPADAMKHLLRTSDSVIGAMTIASRVETTFTAGDWTITFALEDPRDPLVTAD
jgi:hypothetical protein